MTILEANSCGVPAVATQVGGVPDVIRHGVTGFIAPPGDADALAQWVAQLVQDDTQRRAMGEAARQWVEQEFSLRTMLRRYTQLFRSLGQV